MFDDHHLTLRPIQLNGIEAALPATSGLCFLFVHKGAGRYIADTVNQMLAQGDVLVFHNTARGKISVAGVATELKCSYFSATIEYMFPLFTVKEIGFVRNLMSNFKGIKYHSASSPLAVECQRLIGTIPLQFNLEHRIHLLRVVATILSEEFKMLQPQRAATSFISMEEHLLQVFEKLSASDLLSLSVVELAQKFGCSRRHLSRLFHQHFGLSIGALKMEMRMLKAVSLLQESTKIINVAEQCGFNHLGLFNTCFKRRFGASPGQWRSSMLAKAPARTVAVAGDNSHCPLKTNGLCPMLGGANIFNLSGQKTSQLKSAALCAVLADPAASKTKNRAQSAPRIPLGVYKESANHTACQANA